ncbi:transglutaminase domain-containing protein [Virgibacillus tibetensis]|uniref:transglutaminase domain-containing protein n=1 Tax=Virgibacillus tibetensis TaxID=3042313 RepID=UPI002E183B67
MKRICLVLFMIVGFVIAGCSNDDPIEEVKDDRALDGVATEEIESADIQLTSYAEEIGFSLSTPKKEKFNANTKVDIKGKIEADNLSGDYIWVVITREEAIEELETSDFTYYIDLQEGSFSKQMTLHHGAGNYQVSVRVPSNKSDEVGKYYETASFQVVNQDEAIKREVEYTEFGIQHTLQMTNPVRGIESSEGSVSIEGTVPADHAGEMVLVQVEKDNENRQILFPIKESRFTGDIPLYFGEGIHVIRVQLFNEDDQMYYESASYYADNQIEMTFAEMEKFNQYVSRGVTLHEPAWDTVSIQNKQEYRVAGEIDPSAPGADDITYVMVSVNKDDEESGYLIPVKDYQFDGLAYFRFGPGNYEVTINVPDNEKQDQSMFYYQGVARVQHEVTDIADERGLLPSRGIESNHPTIVTKAEEITAGLESDREKAKAIYQYVTQHVAYDVEKAANDTFNIGDSALTTLESGIGICQDYAFLATALLRAIGMESHYVEGYAGERHAWVEVNVDGNWLEMDPTWGAGYVQDGVFHFHYNEDYFDPEPAFLAETHTRDGIMY